jgi:copper(I)-binding protein
MNRSSARALTAACLLLVTPSITLPVLAQHGGHHGAHHATTSATATTLRAGDLVIEQPWTRATPPGARVAGGYLRITNTGREADRLVGGSLAVAGSVEVHEMSNEGGVMRMRELAGGLDIPPGGTVELKPGGLHVMFMGLKQPLVAGQPVEGTLVFQKAGTVAVRFSVGAIGSGKAPDADPHAHH